MKLRIQFHKLGPVRFTSHKDTIRMFQRCFAACNIPVSYSEGFHPHMRLSFAPPLKTGWEGYEEYVDITVDGPPGEIRDRCNAALPEGLRINHVYVLSDRAPRIAADIRAVTVRARVHGDDVPADRADAIEGSLRERFIGAKPAKPAEPAGDEPRILGGAVRGGEGGVELEYTSTSISGRIVSPVEVVGETVGDPADFAVPLSVARLAQFVERDGEFVSPINKGVLLNTS